MAMPHSVLHPIMIKPGNKGKLRATAKRRGLLKGKGKLTSSALSSLRKGASPALEKEVVFAENARKWNH